MKKKILSLLLCVMLVLPFAICAVADSDAAVDYVLPENYSDREIWIPDEIVLLVRTRPQITQISGSDNFMAYGIVLSDIVIFPDLEADNVTEEDIKIAERFNYLLVTLKLADEADMEYALNAVAKHPDVIAYTQNCYCYPNDIIYEIVEGDVNLDGEVDATDYILVKRHCLGTLVLDDVAARYGDTNHDGVLDAQDYAIIKRKVLGTYHPSQIYSGS